MVLLFVNLVSSVRGQSGFCSVETVVFCVTPEGSGFCSDCDMAEKLVTCLRGPFGPGLRVDINRT